MTFELNITDLPGLVALREPSLLMTTSELSMRSMLWPLRILPSRSGTGASTCGILTPCLESTTQPGFKHPLKPQTYSHCDFHHLEVEIICFLHRDHKEWFPPSSSYLERPADMGLATGWWDRKAERERPRRLASRTEDGVGTWTSSSLTR